jgi:hypothetical protein
MFVRQQLGIEMIETRLHLRSLDRGKLILAERRRQIDTTITFRQPEIVRSIPSVAGRSW